MLTLTVLHHRATTEVQSNTAQTTIQIWGKKPTHRYYIILLLYSMRISIHELRYNSGTIHLNTERFGTIR